MQVQISVRDGAASVVFGAHHADTRAAIEQALPRLRELFSNQGLTLADAGVSRESPRGQPQPARAAQIGSVSEVGSNETSVTTVAVARLGLVDTYA
jgi:flagellar hook-length control protein FliK